MIAVRAFGSPWWHALPRHRVFKPTKEKVIEPALCGASPGRQEGWHEAIEIDFVRTKLKTRLCKACLH